jgi:diguanylate cyclase (GGDEF)-like protein
MPYLLVRVLLALLCLGSASAWALAPVPADTLVLGSSNTSFEITSDVATWLDSSAQPDIAVAVRNSKLFETGPALQRHRLGNNLTLWVRLRLVRASGDNAPWTLNIPQPFLDSVTLYQPDGRGGWTAQMAGDTLPQVAWSKRGLYPDFDLQLPAGPPQEVYLKVRNFKHLSMPIRLATLQDREAQRQLEWMALGLMLGALLTVSVLSLIRLIEHRNVADGWAALFGLMILATVAQINGVLNALVWTTLPEWADYANSVMPVVAVGCSLLFMRSLYTLSTHYHRYDRFLDSTAWAAIASVLSYAVLDRVTADWVGAVVLLFVTSVGLLATLLSWRGGSNIWRWLMLAYLPQFLGLLRLMAEAAGLAPTLWEMRYLTSLGVALSVPSMVYALSLITHDRKELVVRAKHLPTQDALTGLLTIEAFQKQLEDAYERVLDSHEPVALIRVHIVNHEHIRSAYGGTTAEHCLLRGVVKLQRILRDIDPAGRVGASSFAILMEGVTTREAVTERMVKLIASGLIPLPGLEPEVTLQFHAACVLLHANPVAPESALAELESVLSGMSPRTRRPIRFLEPVPTLAAAIDTASMPA